MTTFHLLNLLARSADVHVRPTIAQPSAAPAGLKTRAPNRSADVHVRAMIATSFLASLFLGTLATPAQPPTNAPPTPATEAAPIPIRADPPPTASQSASEASAAPATTPSPTATKRPSNGEKGLRLNFRGVPLDMVLSYLSDAAGFIIVMETEVKGKVDVWSQQPLTQDEAINLLNSILNKNGYAAIRNGRTLTIVNRDDAKKRDIPVKRGADPEAIPKTDEMITQIIPVRYANAVQMTKDLQPLLPSYASLSANESGNALVLTDIQSDIRRIVEIVKALDTSISNISTIQVFPLRYADAKELANEIKELFPTPSTSGGRGNDPRAMFMARFGGGPPGGGDGGTGQSEAKLAASRVTAVADERVNALVVSAPQEVMDVIEKLVKEIDTNAENITELRVFHLAHADPVEMADLLASLFPDDSRSDSSRSSIRFGGGRFGRLMGPGMMAASNAPGETSNRARQKNRVVAVADQRTGSLIVTAASDLMPQISEMIAQLDADPAKKQKVFVYSLENADVDNVQQVLQDMFQSQNSRYGSSRNNNSNPLLQRQQNQGYGNTGSGLGSSFGAGGNSTSRRTGR